MDVFKLGLRNVIGITLPGTLLVLFMIYFILMVCVTFGVNISCVFNINNSQIALLIVIGFIVSYFLGSIMRLNSADKLDRQSSRYYSKGDHKNNNLLSFEKTRISILKGDFNVVIPEGFDRWIWRAERFPYPVWQFRKLKLYHPPESHRFFEEYIKCMASTTSGRKGKEFFNYCKMVVYSAVGKIGDVVIQEVNLAEAHVRYYAGTYYALFYSFWILITASFIQCIGSILVFFHLVSFVSTSKWLYLLIFINVILLFICIVIGKMILKRFRTLRLKEVDAVYDAFYLVHRHANECDICSKPAPLSDKHRERENLLRSVFMKDGLSNGITLDDLVSHMKESSIRNKYLSSLYFAGADVDHPFFLNNKKIAIGLSVLPEDSEKAGVAKLHPYQNEVIFVLTGSLMLEFEEEGKTIRKVMNEGDVHIIPAKQCHRVLYIEKKNAVYLFVKTNPAEEPREELCDIFSKE
jgi:mannose-6-phosphate isomerase-like protein (cupin superfamily)